MSNQSLPQNSRARNETPGGQNQAQNTPQSLLDSLPKGIQIEPGQIFLCLSAEEAGLLAQILADYPADKHSARINLWAMLLKSAAVAATALLFTNDARATQEAAKLLGEG